MSAGSRLEELQRVARRAGLGPGPLTIAAAERRRRRLWLLALGAVVVACVAAVAVSVADDSSGAGAVWPLWVAVGVTVVFAVADVLVTERRLEALTRILLDEGIALGVEASRAGELAGLVDAGHAINGDLPLPDALDLILARACEFVGGDSGSIMLLEDDNRLRVVSVQGTTDVLGAITEPGDGFAGRVAADRRPLRMTGLPEREQFDLLADRRVALESAMSLPLIHRTELVGVLNVYAPAARRFTDHDLLLVSVLADLAAVAAATARASDQDRAATLLRGTATAIRRLLPRAGSLAADLRALAMLIDGEPPKADLKPVDVSAAARAAARRSPSDRPVHVRGSDAAQALADPVLLDELLDRLVTHATTNDSGTVEIEIDELAGADAGTVRVTVLDRGPGAPPGLASARQGLAASRSGLAPEPFEPLADGDIGLAAATQLAEAQGATLSARSRTGGGTAVSVVLAAADPASHVG
jgi:anti-sigma regulatory factor (Ser/Thr protein kinase)